MRLIKWMGPLGLLLMAPALLAEPPERDRGVARVSLLNGDVTVQRGDSGDWIAATVNAPLVAGDKIFSARASRAELQFDWANFLRLGENTEVRMADLDRRRYQFQVSRGILTYRILRDSDADVEINTPTVAVRPLKHGSYRIYVLENGQTEITVRDGKAEVSSRQGTETLHGGRTLLVRVGATDNDIQVQEVRAADRDDWDRWNDRRDDQLGRATGYRYVHSSVYGVEDLDDYGAWSSVPGYGYCWFPRVAVGWAPYTYGRWVWIDWYGWTWVPYESWGWAPFHYGRWFFRGGFGWGWYPGAAVYSAWSPALVGFFGHGGFRAGFGFGNIGWVPLAPGERFFPWWGNGFGGRRTNVFVDNSVHITNITNIRNVYRNAGVNGGVVSVNAQEFGRGHVTNIQRVNVNEIRNAGQIRGLVPVVPDRNSLRVTDREVRAASLPRTDGSSDRFFTRRQPPAADRAPFAEQQQQVARSIRGNGAFEGRRAESPTAAAQGAAPSAEGQRSIRSMVNSGPGSSAAPAAAQSPAAAETGAGRQGGWRRFGDRRQAAETSAPAAPAAGRSPRAAEPGPAGPAAAAPTNDRHVDRGAGWRHIGEERRAAPEASAPAPAPQSTAPQRNERPAERQSDWRRFGQPGAEPRSQMNSAPVEPQHESRRPASAAAPLFGRRAEPEARRADSGVSSSGRSERQLEIHRPITVERSAPRNEGGGHSAPAPRSEGDHGGRSADHGGGRRR